MKRLSGGMVVKSFVIRILSRIRDIARPRHRYKVRKCEPAVRD